MNIHIASDMKRLEFGVERMCSSQEQAYYYLYVSASYLVLLYKLKYDRRHRFVSANDTLRGKRYVASVLLTKLPTR